MIEFLEFVAKHLVDNPDAVVIEKEDQDKRIVFKLKVAQTDLGKVIGKGGKTAAALRLLLRAVAAKEGKRAVLDIVG